MGNSGRPSWEAEWRRGGWGDPNSSDTWGLPADVFLRDTASSLPLTEEELARPGCTGPPGKYSGCHLGLPESPERNNHSESVPSLAAVKSICGLDPIIRDRPEGVSRFPSRQNCFHGTLTRTVALPQRPSSEDRQVRKRVLGGTLGSDPASPAEAQGRCVSEILCIRTVAPQNVFQVSWREGAVPVLKHSVFFVTRH